MTSLAIVPKTEMRNIDYVRELEGAKTLLASGLLPDTVKSPEAALFIILTGRDLGLSPVQSLRSINIIKGKVEVSADQQLGLFHRAGGKSQWVTLTETEAVLRLSAPWLLAPHEERFTMVDAKRAGIDRPGKSGEPSMFTKFPKAMLRSRAITAGLKSVGFDPTAGVYDYGEIGGPEPAISEDPITAQTGAVIAEAEQTGTLHLDEPEDIEQTDEEKMALAELEDFLAENSPLTSEQQEYVRTRLSDGADPVSLCNAVKIKLQNKERAKA